jgi:hypothetical protein
MVSEESTLLTSTRDDLAHKSIYDRFTPGQKIWIVFVVSCAGLLPSKHSVGIYYSPNTLGAEKQGLSVFVSATFVPSIPQIAKDLHSTHAVVRCVFYEFM